MGYILLSWIGNAVFFHRYVSHKSFETDSITKFIGIMLGTLAGKGSPIDWAAIHRYHHMHADTDKDPHNPRLEGWRLWVPYLLKYKTAFSPRIIVDLLKDPLYRFLQKYYWLVVFGFIMVLGVIDFNTLMYLYVIPMVITNLLLGLVVYLLHTYGDKPNAQTNESRNNWFVNIIQGGEGWHNNHHATPGNYRAGPWDPCARFIELIQI